MYYKKAIVSVIASSILIIITVFTIISFQNWYISYSLNINNKIEIENNISDKISIETIIGNSLYLKNNEEVINSLIIKNSKNEEICIYKDNNINIENNLIGFWDFDDEYSVVYDKSNNSNHATLYGDTKVLVNFDDGTTNGKTAYNINMISKAGVRETADLGSDQNHVVETSNYAIGYYDDVYNGWTFKATSGIANGQTTIISDYIVYDTQFNKHIIFQTQLIGFTSGDNYEIYYGDDKTLPRIIENGLNAKAIEFDGIDDYLEGQNNFNLVGTNKLTLSAWIKPYSQKTGTIMSKNGPFNLQYNFNKKIKFSIHNGTWDDSNSNSLVNINEWTHIVALYDGKYQKIYINGKLDSIRNKTGNMTGNGCFQIGRSTNGGCDGGNANSYFNGSIDEITVYTKALNDYEILDLYNSRKAKFIEYVDSPIDKAIKYDGIDDYVKLPDLSNYVQDGFSAVIKIKKESQFPLGNRWIFGSYTNWSPGNAAFLIWTDENNPIPRLYFKTQGTIDSEGVIYDNMNFERWTTIVANYNLSKINLYLDGIKIAERDFNQDVSNRNNWHIGFPIPYQIKGEIEEVRLYNKTLSKEEIEQIDWYYTKPHKTGIANIELKNCNFNKGEVYDITLITDKNIYTKELVSK